jgi:hypothetical protein
MWIDDRRIWIDNRQISERDIQAYINEQRQLTYNRGCGAMTKYWIASINKYEDDIAILKKDLANVRRQYSRLKNKVDKEKQTDG